MFWWEISYLFSSFFISSHRTLCSPMLLLISTIIDISTTTVGLGDYYLEHGVIVGYDLLVWPLLFLFGFVLLSSFLTKVAEFLASFFPSDKPTFAESLADADVPLFPCL